MKANLKTIALAVIASFAFTACTSDAVCKSNPVASAAPTQIAVADVPTLEKNEAKPRRTRRTKKDNAAAPDGEKQKQPRRRRTRKTQMSALPVTGMLDSAE